MGMIISRNHPPHATNVRGSKRTKAGLKVCGTADKNVCTETRNKVDPLWVRALITKT